MKPKYNTGDNVYYLDRRNKIAKGKVTTISILTDKPKILYKTNYMRLTEHEEDEIFPSKQSLIKHLEDQDI